MPEKVKSSELTPEKEIVKPKAAKKVKTFLNKVVIRKLPPNLTSDEFLEIISPIPEYTDYYFVKADWSLGVEATSRAYIEFKNQEDIFIFKDKFDEYVFVDNVRGTEYAAIVEFAPFQNLPKSRARKDKHVNSIENEQHFLNFLEMLKKSEDVENQKVEPKLEYSYQIKDDKKITSTPLLEFIAASKEEKREAKKKKIEDKKKAREEEKQKKKLQIAKNIPEPIKETKEEKEIIYDDGVMVRVVPSRLGRNDKNSRKDVKSDNKEKDMPIDKERRDKKEKEREERKKIQREKDEKRKQERAKEREAKKSAKVTSEKKPDASDSQNMQTQIAATDEPQSKNSQPKKEIKRYSELRKARQEKTNNESKDNEIDTNTSVKLGEKSVAQSQSISTSNQDVSGKSDEQFSKIEDKSSKTVNDSDEDPRWKRIQELREKRELKKEEIRNEKKLKNEKSAAAKSEDDASTEKHEKDERSQRQIRNKDRPAQMIYRPKRVSESVKSETGNSIKSSDENSESTRKRELKNEKKSSRRDSRDDRKKRMSRKNSNNSNGDEENIETKSIAPSEEKHIETDTVTEKLQELTLDASETIKEIKINEDT